MMKPTGQKTVLLKRLFVTYGSHGEAFGWSGGRESGGGEGKK